VNPPTSQKRSGVKTPASYIPHQTVNSTNFPFASKQINARPKSHIGLPSLESISQVPVLNQGSHDRQTQSPGVPVTQSPGSQPKLSQPQQQQPVTNTPVSYVRMDVQNLSQDMHRLSLDQVTLEQARLAKQTKLTTQTTTASVTKSASSGSLAQQGVTSRPIVSVGNVYGGEFTNESYQSQAAGHHMFYQEEAQAGMHSLQEG